MTMTTDDLDFDIKVELKGEDLDIVVCEKEHGDTLVRSSIPLQELAEALRPYLFGGEIKWHE